jgi:hypothetical protein
MQLFTALLSALALVASTTTANPDWTPQRPIPELQVLEPGWGETWQIGSSMRVSWVWDPNEMPVQDYNLTGSIILANEATGSDNKTCKVLPNLLCFTVVVTQQYLSFTCTCNPLFSEPSTACNMLQSGSWGGKCHRAERAIFPRLFCYS